MWKQHLQRRLSQWMQNKCLRHLQMVEGKGASGQVRFICFIKSGKMSAPQAFIKQVCIMYCLERPLKSNTKRYTHNQSYTVSSRKQPVLPRYQNQTKTARKRERYREINTPHEYDAALLTRYQQIEPNNAEITLYTMTKWGLLQGCEAGSKYENRSISVMHHVNSLHKKNHLIASSMQISYTVWFLSSCG